MPQPPPPGSTPSEENPSPFINNSQSHTTEISAEKNVSDSITQPNENEYTSPVPPPPPPPPMSTFPSYVQPPSNTGFVNFNYLNFLIYLDIF